MTRAEKIEFVKQQTELAKKVALRPHLAESDVLAAILELDNKVTLIPCNLFQNNVFSRRSRRRLRKLQLQQMTLFCKIIQYSSFIRYPHNAEPSLWR
jgi:adenine C2-methylase RlmN of 23S rRNA A2503 and tRNA A37